MPDGDCTICHDIILNMTYTNCKHFFCYQCILKWTEMNNECPLCKSPIKFIRHNIISDNDCKYTVIPSRIFPRSGNRHSSISPINNPNRIISQDTPTDMDISDSTDNIGFTLLSRPLPSYLFEPIYTPTKMPVQRSFDNSNARVISQRRFQNTSNRHIN